MIFVDTGAWFASIVNGDVDHTVASVWFAQNSEPLMTTDYVVDETLTLLRARGEPIRALELGQAFFSGDLAAVYHLSEHDVLQAWKVFQDFSDKGWSFTDCTSKAIMEKLGITHAIAFDQHFRQFGTITVFP